MTQSYNSEQMKSLSWQEQARTRPGMWIGATGNAGVLHLINEAIDNSVDEFTTGFGKTIKIAINTNKNQTQTITIEDEGRGIPYGLNEQGVNTFTASATVMFTGGKYDNASYKFNAGMNGSGLKLINVFSTNMILLSRRDGNQYKQEFSLGYPKSEIETSVSQGTGTSVIFTPDPEIFGDYCVTKEDIIFRCKCIASLVPGCQVIGYIDNEIVCDFLEKEELVRLLEDVSFNQSSVFSFDYCGELSTTEEKGENIPYKVSFSLRYYPTNNKNSLSFCNTVYTSDAGSHDDAFMRVLRDSLKKVTGYSVNNSQVSTGLSYILSVSKQNPLFRGQSKTRVSDETIYNCVYKDLYPVIYQAIADNKEFVNYFTQLLTSQDKLIEETALKEASQNIKESVKNNELPKSLKIAYGYKPSERELLIVEGKSASGSVKEAALPYQEVLPLRGKVLNTAKSEFSNIIKNQEIKDIFKAVGGMEGTNTALRTHNVFIVNDADPDGCLRGNTKLPLLDGQEVEIKDLCNEKGFWVYSCKENGEVVPGYAHDCRITRYVNSLYRITLDNDEVIECTDNHPFLLRNGTYVRADELQVNMSIMPFNRRIIIDSSGLERPEIYSIKRWRKEHHLVWESYNNITRDKYTHIHHINGNTLDNSPTNLIQLTSSQHTTLHNQLNKENHSLIMKQLHKDGIYIDSCRQNIIAYNKSDKHRKTVSTMNGKGGVLYEANKERIIAYNKSQEHREQVSETNKKNWKNPEYRKKRIEELKISGKKMWENEETRKRIKITPCVSVVKKCLSLYGYVNESLYNQEKPKKGVYTWESFLKKAGIDSDSVLEYVKNYNHKVKSIEVISVDNEPVYDITVDNTHNFALSSGVFVHNSHIAACIITLFIKLFPSFVKNHNLYVCQTPLFTATDGVRYEYGNTAKLASARFRKRFGKSRQFQIMRAKGLGELNAEEIAPFLAPETRTVTKVIFSEETEVKIEKIMGKSSEVRKEILENIDLEGSTSLEFGFVDED